MIKAKINNVEVQVNPGTTILEAAEAMQVHIPALCRHPDLTPTGACGICIVRVKGSNKMLRACCSPLEENMDIVTHDRELQEIRRSVLELILSNHPNDCLQCGRNNNCELQKLAADFGIREFPFPQFLRDLPKDSSTETITLEPEKCIL